MPAAQLTPTWWSQKPQTSIQLTDVLQHIKQQYQELKPILDALVAAYPAHLQAAWFSWEAYLWAVQLWYAYAMQVSLHTLATSMHRVPSL